MGGTNGAGGAVAIIYNKASDFLLLVVEAVVLEKWKRWRWWRNRTCMVVQVVVVQVLELEETFEAGTAPIDWQGILPWRSSNGGK